MSIILCEGSISSQNLVLLHMPLRNLPVRIKAGAAAIGLMIDFGIPQGRAVAEKNQQFGGGFQRDTGWAT
ncbi:hypothetical protein [Phaeobacter inhibens]|uniref:hypothetical protein n=1 Tax=Phaeobacter inhibens TaxID=221822 RepID=UPI0021A35140|nr:hypothetical protein [Phaeobacter inhibens]UWR55005.1 hypothetical protein K4F84_19495 [Phaeobacter inhibens]UWR70596.1 hypothetical protein K4K95_19705 [Phaeobacter inhibens]UWR74440.1 hypothetical protein K4L00_19120 [Phaeobacter inhibens]UWR98272.1 hypothetical protein K4K99_18870 [Phaeobacter inhibens]UWS10035.1 hypothetical protein K4K98_18350 [Phaeobacter inhibens]